MKNHVNIPAGDSPLPSLDAVKTVLFSMNSCLELLCLIEEEARRGHNEPLMSLLESADNYRITHVETKDGEDGEDLVSMTTDFNAGSVELGHDSDGVYICMTAHDVMLGTHLESMSRQAMALEVILHEAQTFAMSRMDEYGDDSNEF